MIRIFLPLLLAVVAFFGPWTASDRAGSFYGHDSAGTTVDCLLDLNLSVKGACAPAGASIAEQLIGWTVLAGMAAAVLSVLGLLPVIGRLTSLLVIGAGLVGLGAAGMTLMQLTGTGALPISAIGWGTYGALALGLACLWAGIDGVRHGNE
mgnify:CR=1 FL=1